MEKLKKSSNRDARHITRNANATAHKIQHCPVLFFSSCCAHWKCMKNTQPFPLRFFSFFSFHAPKKSTVNQIEHNLDCMDDDTPCVLKAYHRFSAQLRKAKKGMSNCEYITPRTVHPAPAGAQGLQASLSWLTSLRQKVHGVI